MRATAGLAITVAGAFLCAPLVAQTRRPNTPVAITHLSWSRPQEYVQQAPQGRRLRLVASVENATAQSQLVLLLRYSRRSGLAIAADEHKEPVLPQVEVGGQQRAPNTPFPGRVRPSEWQAEFQVREDWGELQEIVAVVCSVTERQDWSRSRDYRGLSYLPFNRVSGVDEALELLRNFGWIPTGLTRVVP